MTLADRIVCLDAGQIAQVGTPDDLYNRPGNIFVASFIGSPQINLLEVTAEGSGLRLADGQELPLPDDLPRFVTARKLLLGLRPENLIDQSRLAGLPSVWPLTMDFVLSETLGSDTYVIGDMAGRRVTARCAPGTHVDPGAKVSLRADTSRLHLFDPETRERL